MTQLIPLAETITCQYTVRQGEISLYQFGAIGSYEMTITLYL
jgi:hypothetical protein